MASVWIARHSGKHGFEKFVAVKTVLPKFASDARFQQMFQDETRIASRIEHTNVAQILDVGEQHEITYLVMEYVDGESLSTLHRTLAKKGMRIPPGVVLRILADVCGGLHTAHELREGDGELLGVVHRDVSPQNVLVNTKGVAKLIDFGIAKARDRIVGDTTSGQVKGKIRYMAPEQALGSALDRRADIWAVGAVLYHLLSGKPPYDGENDVQTLMVLTSGRPPVPLPPEVNPAIAAVAKRALSIDVSHRFATAADMQQALEEAMTEAKVVTNHTAIAAFLVEHVAERTKKRKDAIAVGVKAAKERDRYAEIMRSNLKVTAGVSANGNARLSEAPGPGSRSGVGSHSGMGTPSLGSLADMASRNGSGPGSASGRRERQLERDARPRGDGRRKPPSLRESGGRHRRRRGCCGARRGRAHPHADAPLRRPDGEQRRGRDAGPRVRPRDDRRPDAALDRRHDRAEDARRGRQFGGRRDDAHDDPASSPTGQRDGRHGRRARPGRSPHFPPGDEAGPHEDEDR